MESRKPALYLLDSYGIIYRSYYAFINRPLKNPQGANVSAVYGFFRFLFALFEERNPGAFAAVFDSAVPTFRHEMYPAYKATRQKTPEDLHAQVPLVEEILQALGLPLLRADGYEADDLIAALAERCRAEDRECWIVSGDKDLLQLVGGPVRALRPEKDTACRSLGPAEVEAEWGVPPPRILDYLSLTGDSSDNVPGVPGIGDKTAQKLLAEYGTLDGLYERLESVKPDGVRNKLAAGRESAYLSRTLITLASDAPLPVAGTDELEVGPLDRAAAGPIFLREGMRSLAGRAGGSPAVGAAAAGTDLFAPAAPGVPETAAHGRGPTPPAQPAASPFPPAVDPAVPPGLAGPGEYEAVTDEAALDRWLAAAARAGTFAFDCETDGLDDLAALPVGFSLAVEPRKACYVPIRCPEGTTIPETVLKARLGALLAREDLVMAGQNLKFDRHILENWGIPVRCRPWDTMIAAWLLDAERSAFNLEALAESYLGYRGIRFDEVVPKGSTFDKVPLSQAARYAAEDADLTLRLALRFEPELARAGLSDLFRDVEMPLLPVLGDMERAGIRVDPEELRRYGRELDISLRNIEAEIYRLVGHEFNIASTKQLQEVLFTERKLKTGKKTKTGYSTDISVLEELAREDPVPERILRHRTLAKLKSTYVDSLAELAGPDGRIHTHFVQTGAATGRLSSRDPNLQNIPIREEEGRRIRHAFSADPGHVLVSADYSQIELVVFAHLSGDPELRRAFAEGADIHRRTASLIFGIPEAQVGPDQRRIAKTINFGVVYGMSAFRLSNELGIGRAEAQKFIDAYFERYAGVRRFMDATISAAEKDGCVRTLLGRRRPVPAVVSRNKTEKQAAERVAVNTPIQGSAADIVKLAMLRVRRVLADLVPEARLLLQVHDELIAEVPEARASETAEVMKREMEGAVRLTVPLRVDVETAARWGEMH